MIRTNYEVQGDIEVAVHTQGCLSTLSIYLEGGEHVVELEGHPERLEKVLKNALKILTNDRDGLFTVSGKEVEIIYRGKLEVVSEAA